MPDTRAAGLVVALHQLHLGCGIVGHTQCGQAQLLDDEGAAQCDDFCGATALQHFVENRHAE